MAPRNERAGYAALLSSPKGGHAARDRSASARPATPASDLAMVASVPRTPGPGDVIQLAPNIISVKHWDRLMGGLLYAVQPRVDWAMLLRRGLSVEVLECPKCHGRLRVLAVITEREPVQPILAHLGLPTEPRPSPAHAIRPTTSGTMMRLRTSPSAAACTTSCEPLRREGRRCVLAGELLKDRLLAACRSA